MDTTKTTETTTVSPTPADPTTTTSTTTTTTVNPDQKLLKDHLNEHRMLKLLALAVVLIGIFGFVLVIITMISNANEAAMVPVNVTPSPVSSPVSSPA